MKKSQNVEELTRRRLENFRAKSAILNPLGPDEHRAPIPGQFLMSVDNMKGHLSQILSQEIRVKGCGECENLGWLPHARFKLQEAEKQWASFAKDTGEDVKSPRDWHCEQIAYWTAKVRILELEAETLQAAIKDIEEKERAELQRRKNKRLQRGKGLLSGKKIGGRWVEWAGRSVTRDEQGRDVFSDDGTTVASYIEQVKMARLKHA